MSTGASFKQASLIRNRMPVALWEVAGAAASQEHRLGQQWVTGSLSFQLGWCLQAVNFSAGFAVWGVWENSHFSVSMKSSQDLCICSLRAESMKMSYRRTRLVLQP